MQDDGYDTWVADPLLDCSKKAFIPGSSLKGALRAMGQRHQLDALCDWLFGHEEQNTSQSGQAEFFMAGTERACEYGIQTRVAIQRSTGTSAPQKLFQTPYLPAGTVFKAKIIVHDTDTATIERFIHLLKSAQTDSGFIVGSHGSQGYGRAYFDQIQVKRFGAHEATTWLKSVQAGQAQSWTTFAEPHAVTSSFGLERLKPQQLEIPLQLEFDSPFLVKTVGQKSLDQADAIPFTRQGKVTLPGSSLRGCLRSQAERILRTMGIATPEGHACPPLTSDAIHTDLTALLFGCAGWRSIVQTTDLTSHTHSTVRQEMVAIDRFSGACQEGAKFNIDRVESPVLTGKIIIDWSRLAAAQLGHPSTPALPMALGLLTLLWRDLAEGDIPMGYGIAKGYGHHSSPALMKSWDQVLTKAATGLTAASALEALRTWAGSVTADPQALQSPSAVKNSSTPYSVFQPRTTPYSVNKQKFHNPYQFIPLAPSDGPHWPKIETILKERGLNRYQGLSGRLCCELITVTPIFIGGKRHAPAKAKDPTPVDPFYYKKQLGIPATSLRGMLSSLHESISSSRMRILNADHYSMRKKPGTGLSAMGEIIFDAEKNDYKLLPLTWPTLESRNGQEYTLDAKWKNLKGFTNFPRLRVFFDPPKSSRRQYRADQMYYLEYALLGKSKEKLFINQDPLRHPQGGRTTNFVIGQSTKVESVPITEAEYQLLSPAEKLRYVRGRVRSIKSPNEPYSKGQKISNRFSKHHVFLPCPPRDLATPVDANLAAKKFHQLADILTKDVDTRVPNQALMPFVPIGRRSQEDRKEKTTPGTPPWATRLSHGDLVFFDIDQNTGKVTEISFSSIWRTGLMKPTGELLNTMDLLSDFDPYLPPLGMGKATRTAPVLSSVEILFGVVESVSKDDISHRSDHENLFSLASRVTISTALPAKLSTVRTLPPVILQELSTPKPLSPNFYFSLKNRRAAYTSKDGLSKEINKYTLRGRKQYLHAWSNRGGVGAVQSLDHMGYPQQASTHQPNWRTGKKSGPSSEDLKRNVVITPIDKNQSFYFNIDFFNLEQGELEQLCAALLPDPHFVHRIGMGKPLGLGSVRLKVNSLEVVDRPQRYLGDQADAPRVHQRLGQDDIKGLAAAGMSRVPGSVRRALQLIGNPASVQAPVHYPQIEDSRLEEKQFQWFTANDDTSRHAPRDNQQTMPSIDSATDALPVLTRIYIEPRPYR